MKIFISILDLNTQHLYKKTHVDVWSSQERKIYTLEKEKNGIILNANIDHQIPLGVVFGVYGTMDNNIVHCVGFCMFDISFDPWQNIYSLFDPALYKLRCMRDVPIKTIHNTLYTYFWSYNFACN